MRIGVDTGGTFTDFIALHEGAIVRSKLPSTPGDPSRAVAAGVSTLDPRSLATVIHGTTVATNALLQGRLGKVAFVTNEGFEDILEIGRQARPDLYAFEIHKAPPLVPRERRIGVKQRTTSDGDSLVPLSARSIAAAVVAVKRTRPDAIAVGLLFSFLDGAAERALGRALSKLGVSVTLSSSIAPSIREYERFATTVANAALTPVVASYLLELERSLGSRSLFVFQSNGGTARAAAAAKTPVRLVLSGPAGGAVAAQRVATAAGLKAAIALDMGGTSTDVALLRGTPQRRSEIEFAGHPLVVPALDIESVGAGGGSIAYVDSSGMLRVGPRSAGAVPGPACYGKGDEPTVTDAHVVLGRLPLELAGGVTLDPLRSHRALANLGKQIGRSAVAAADAVLDLADAAMARAARIVAVARGADPRDLELIAFGGAGGLHASRLVRVLPCAGALVPPMPGHLSALGMVLADPEVDLSQTVLVRDVDTAAARRRLETALVRLERDARERLRASGVERMATVEVERDLACRYVGQTFTLDVPFSKRIIAAFHAAHAHAFGHAFSDRAIEVVDVKVRARAPRDIPFPVPRLPRGRKITPFAIARASHRGKATSIACYRRDELPVGSRIEGFARIDDDGATILVEPGDLAVVDRHGNLRIKSTRSSNRL